MKFLRFFLSCFVLIGAYLFFHPISVSAVTYDLIAPEGTLTRDQEVQFIVNIDTQASSIATSEVGLSYQSQYLQYVSITPGDTMTSVSAVQSGTDGLVLSGTNSAGFNGTGVFAYVTFKIIATGPGTAELCALFIPSPTPSAAPATPTMPIPTKLPVTGGVENNTTPTVAGLVLITSSLMGFFFLKNRYSK